MPCHSKLHNKGGQRRTCVLPCGKVIQDKPERLQYKLDLHQKMCETCKKYDRFVSKDHEFETGLNAVDFRGGSTYSKQKPAIMRAVNNEGDVQGVSCNGDATTNAFWDDFCKLVEGQDFEFDETGLDENEETMNDVPVFALVSADIRMAFDPVYKEAQLRATIRFAEDNLKDVKSKKNSKFIELQQELWEKYYPHEVLTKPGRGDELHINILHKDTNKLIHKEIYKVIDGEWQARYVKSSITKGMKKNMKKTQSKAKELLALCWSWDEHKNSGYDEVLKQLKTIHTPNINFRANVGTGEEQVANAIGDCVSATFNKLKELSDKFGDEHFVSKTLVCPTTRSNNPLEEFVVHHVVVNTKLNLVMDFSNRRQVCVDVDTYIAGCNPPLIKMENVGRRMNEWREITIGWMSACHLPVANFHDGCVWLMMEMLHSLELERENKHFTANIDMDYFINWMKQVALQGWDDWYKQFMVEWSSMTPNTSVF